MLTDSTGYIAGLIAIGLIIKVAVGLLVAYHFFRVIKKTNEINDHMDDLINSTMIEYDDFDSLSEDDRFAYIEQKVRMEVYQKKRSSIRLMNGLRLTFFLPAKKYDVLGQTDEILEPTYDVPDGIYDRSQAVDTFAARYGISLGDHNVIAYYYFYEKRYEYWEEHFYD